MFIDEILKKQEKELERLQSFLSCGLVENDCNFRKAIVKMKVKNEK